MHLALMKYTFRLSILLISQVTPDLIIKSIFNMLASPCTTWGYSQDNTTPKQMETTFHNDILMVRVSKENVALSKITYRDFHKA